MRVLAVVLEVIFLTVFCAVIQACSAIQWAVVGIGAGSSFVGIAIPSSVLFLVTYAPSHSCVLITWPPSHCWM